MGTGTGAGSAMGSGTGSGSTMGAGMGSGSGCPMTRRRLGCRSSAAAYVASPPLTSHHAMKLAGSSGKGQGDSAAAKR